MLFFESNPSTVTINGIPQSFVFIEQLHLNSSPVVVGDKVTASGSWESVSGAINGSGGNFTFTFHNGSDIEVATGGLATFTISQPGSFTISMIGSIDVDGRGIATPNPLVVSDDAIVAATPLPPTAWMMITGLVGLGFIAFRSRKQTASFAAI